MAPDFIPFRATPEKLAAQKVLRDGVPPSMRSSLMAWLRVEVCGSTDSGLAHMAVLRSMENNLDWSLGLPSDAWLHAETAMTMLGNLDGEQLLQGVHFLAQKYKRRNESALYSLDGLLSEGRSKWQVGPLGNQRYGLVERVPEGVQTAAEQLIARGGAAGELLAQAWQDAYELEPRDSSAYWNAVKAVEAAALPAMGLNRANATLDSVARELEPGKVKGEIKWRLPFLREHSNFPSQEVLLGMLKTLYRGQRDRHGAEAYEGVTHDEAVAAVLMAVSLVGWFSGGLVQERDPAQHP